MDEVYGYLLLKPVKLKLEKSRIGGAEIYKSNELLIKIMQKVDRQRTQSNNFGGFLMEMIKKQVLKKVHE